jgi:hypothetical protein
MTDEEIRVAKILSEYDQYDMGMSVKAENIKTAIK